MFIGLALLYFLASGHMISISSGMKGLAVFLLSSLAVNYSESKFSLFIS
jgi:hypothetical protein